MADNYTFSVFEIIPLERLLLDKDQTDISTLAEVLNTIGYRRKHFRSMALLFEIAEKDRLQHIAQESLGGNEYDYAWLVTDFFEDLIILPGKHDILFALATTKPLTMQTPHGMAAWAAATELGWVLFPPTIPRILFAEALLRSGHLDIGNAVNCRTNMPRESALSGDIHLVGWPIETGVAPREPALSPEWQPLPVLSSQMLLSNGLIDLLRTESMLDSLQLGEALPLQMYSLPLEADQRRQEEDKQYLNFLRIRARSGSAFQLFDELMHIALHLNWRLAVEYTSSLPEAKAFEYSLMQRNRLKQIEERENAFRNSLHILQKRYPTITQLLEWEVTNLYANIIRYSPLYLDWKANLESYIQGKERTSYSLLDLVAALDWERLEQNGVASIQDAQRILKLIEIDPGSTLTRMRVIIEKIVTLIYKRSFPGTTSETLSEMLQRLNKKNAFPPIIYVYLNTLRLAGNIGAHQGLDAKKEVEAILPVFVRVVEWFVDQLGLS